MDEDQKLSTIDHLHDVIGTYAETHQADVDRMRQQADTIASLRAGDGFRPTDATMARVHALQAQLYRERESADRTALELRNLRLDLGRQSLPQGAGGRNALYCWGSEQERDQSMFELALDMADLPLKTCFGHKCLTGHRARTRKQ